MPAITNAYMDWTVQYADRNNPDSDPPPSPNDGEWPVRVINLFSERVSFCGCFGLFTN
jgi:hypothetical protein